MKLQDQFLDERDADAEALRTSKEECLELAKQMAEMEKMYKEQLIEKDRKIKSK